MGFKAFNLIATTGDETYLTTFPPHRPDRAREFLSRLGGHYELVGPATLESGVYPSDDKDMYVGAYDRALVIGALPLADEAFSGAVPRAVSAANDLLPNSRAIIILLHSVVDAFGYAFYENGHLLRARGGSADDGIFHDSGPLHPVEQKHKAFDETIDGEELVMELCRPFLGCRLDEFDAWDLNMEHFRKAPTADGILTRLFSRR
jgi:hypothetical protein